MAKFLSQRARQFLPSTGKLEASFGTPRCLRLGHGQQYTNSMILIWLSGVAALTPTLGAFYGPAPIFLLLQSRFFLIMSIVQRKECFMLRTNLMFKLGISLIHQSRLHWHGQPMYLAADQLVLEYSTATARCFLDHICLIKWPLMLKQARLCGTQKPQDQCFFQALILTASSSEVAHMTTLFTLSTLTLEGYCGLTTQAHRTDTGALVQQPLTAWFMDSTKTEAYM